MSEFETQASLRREIVIVKACFNHVLIIRPHCLCTLTLGKYKYDIRFLYKNSFTNKKAQSEQKKNNLVKTICGL